MEAKYTIQRREIQSALDFPGSVHPVVKRVYQHRKINNINEIENKLDKLHNIKTLSGLSAAVALLAAAVSDDQRILIVGDFDADGATSTALALRALKAMGAKQAGYLVPNRFEFGYGLTPEIVHVALDYQPDILVTVDNGISSIEGVDAAHQHGIKVIITDHHLPGAQLPAADAIVNPNLPNDDFPSKCLAGVGVIFYVMLGLRSALRENGWFARQNIQEPNMAQYLDLVALGTVADVVPLDHNNRILVDQGIKRIRAKQCVPGIIAMLESGKRKPANTVASDLGFAAGPRLNAAGRLEDMSLGIECLLTDDAARAAALAAELNELNRQRREIEQEMQAQAVQIVEQLSAELVQTELPAGLCLFDPRWHQGVVGLVASRIKEKTQRPVIAFAKISETELKGSARSISGLHIRDALDAVATRHPGLIKKFGGHAMAAGLSLPLENFDQFRDAFAQQVGAVLETKPGEAVILTDGELNTSELNAITAEALRRAGPWGQGFPEPLFDGVFNINSKRIVGESHLKLQLAVPESAQIMDAIAFNEDGSGLPESTKQVRVVYHLEINEFRGIRSPQLNVRYIEPLKNP